MYLEEIQSAQPDIDAAFEIVSRIGSVAAFSAARDEAIEQAKKLDALAGRCSNGA